MELYNNRTKRPGFACVKSLFQKNVYRVYKYLVLFCRDPLVILMQFAQSELLKKMMWGGRKEEREAVVVAVVVIAVAG